MEDNLIRSKARFWRGGHYDQWDLQVFGGFFSSARGLLTIEEHGGGKQLLRFRIWAKYPLASIVLTIALGVLSGVAAADSSYVASLILGFSSFLLTVTCSADKARAMYELSNAFSQLGETYQLADPSPEESSKQLETWTEAHASPVYLSRERGSGRRQSVA